MALREILASFGVAFDGKELAKGESLVEGMVGKLKGFGGLLAGAFGGVIVTEFTHSLLEEADALAKSSEGLGLTAKSLQELEHAAGLSGVGVDELRGALGRLNREAVAAQKGGGDLGATFKALKIDPKKFTDSGDLFVAAGVAIGKVEDPFKRAQAASQIFGKSYARLLPLFKEGQEGIDKLKAEVGELGFAFDDAFLENAQEVNDNVERLEKGVKGLAIQAIGPLLPDLVKLTQSGVALIKQFVAFTKGTKLVQTGLVTLAGAGVAGLITKLGGLGGALTKVAGFALRTLLPFFALEDLFVFLAGGKSEIGEGIGAAFGPETKANVDAWIAGVRTEVEGFFTDISKNPKKFAEDMKVVFEGLRSKKFWQWIFGDNALAEWAQFWTDLLTTPGGFQDRLKAAVQGTGDGTVKGATRGQNESSWLDAIPGSSLLKGPSERAEERFRAQGGGSPVAPAIGPHRGENATSWLDSIPGSSWLKGPSEGAEQRFRASLPDTRVATASAPRAPASVSNVVVNNDAKTTVNVTAATPQELVRKVSDAATRGVQKGLDLTAAHAAIVQNAG
jgi:hypothetical protein